MVSFYHLVNERAFDRAAELWTPRMQAQFPPAENIWQRFARVERITVQRAEIVAVDQAAGRATVAVDLIEVGGPPSTSRRWVGSWQLVREHGSWLLDQPSLRAG